MSWRSAIVLGVLGILPLQAGLAPRIPLRFEENRTGSVVPGARYVARGEHYSLCLSTTESVLSWPASNGREAATLRTRLLGSRPEVIVAGVNRSTGSVNYFIGTPAEWQTDVPSYSGVKYTGIYRGIDLIFHEDEAKLEYDFVVGPQADPGTIRLELTGQRALRIDDQGDLVVGSAAGDVHWKRPVIYQEIDGSRRAISGGFALLGKNQVGFRVGGYDHKRELIIDPTLSYSTFLGGSGNDAARGIAVDASGNVFIAGNTNSNNLAVSSAFQSALGGQTLSYISGDAFVAKFSSTGALLYLTYLGGTADESATAITVDAAGNAYVTGFTTSSNFPVTPNAFQKSFGGFGGNGYIRAGDAFVTKLNPAGNQLIYSTYLGGRLDDAGAAILVDSSGSAYVAGSTVSQNFPTTAGAYQTNNHGAGGQPDVPVLGLPNTVAGDAFVAKLNPAGSQLIFSTLIGGSLDDLATSIGLDGSNNVYIGGSTLSSDFPTTAGAFQKSFGGTEPQNQFFHLGDGFVAKFNPSGTALIYSTYFGGSGDDWVSSIAVDGPGDVFFTGSTSTRQGFPTTPGAYQRAYAGYASLPFLIEFLAGDAYVAKLNPAGSALVYCTYLGGSLNESATAIAIDNAGNAYVTGFTDSRDFPTTADALQPAFAGDGGAFPYFFFGDAFLAEINNTGSALLFSTFLGSSKDDIGLGLFLDNSGNAHVAGVAGSSDFKLSANAAQKSFGGSTAVAYYARGDAFYTKVSGFPTSGSPPSAPTLAAITNGASNLTGPISPGMIFVAYGTNMGPTTLVGASLDANGLLAAAQSGSRMLFDGRPAPIVYSSANQFSGIVPYGVTINDATQIVSEYQGRQSPPLTAQVVAAAPGLFSANFTGSGPAVVYNQDGTVNSPANPADKGSVIVLYGTGEGLTSPAGVDGKIASVAPYPSPTLPVTANVGSLPATILYKGSVPFQVAGLLQINVQISQQIPSGNQPIIVTVGSARTQPNLTVSIR